MGVLASSPANISVAVSTVQSGLASAAEMRVFPSVANFLMFAVEAETAGEKFGAHMLSHGIAVRDLRTMPGCKVGLYRVGVRNREDNKRLVNEAGKWRR